MADVIPKTTATTPIQNETHMTILHIDFETFSACDLKTAGLDNYARDPTTGVHCMAFAFDDGPVDLVLPSDGLDDCIEDYILAGGLVYAHNAPFEWAIWNHIMVPRYGWPDLKIEQCRCTMAMAYAMGLPGALEDAAPALGIDARKDMKGKAIMLRWCKPKADGTFYVPGDDLEKFQRLCDYCKQDVEVERALHKRLMELSPSEQKLWELDHRINQRGVLIDLTSVDKALALVKLEQDRLNSEMLKATDGFVGKCTEASRLVQWLRREGVEIERVAKADVLDALSEDGLPAQARRALELRKEAAKSSTAKLVAMKQRAAKDGRVRGIHQFHGAATGRWAGRGVQFQNVPRWRPGISQKEVDDMFAHLHDKSYIDMFYGPTMDALVDCLRGMVVAPSGKDLVAVDFSAVEARVLAWLAGQDDVLDAFRNREDIYKLAASRIYRVPKEQVDKQQRQIGKVATLALGYQGGVGAFQSMAKNYNVKLPDSEVEEIRDAWRAAHPKIANRYVNGVRVSGYWGDLEEAAILALKIRGTVSVGPAGRQVVYKKAGSFLWCKLPSGRVLCYPYPELRTVTTSWGEDKEALTYMTAVSNPKAKIVEDPNSKGTWKRTATYGGSLAENVTQAVARDLLAEALIRMEDASYQVIFHVHDEAVIEITSASGVAEIASSADTDALSKIEALMAVVPNWAHGLPLAAEGWRGPRYRKA
jgi:DNA polymerase